MPHLVTGEFNSRGDAEDAVADLIRIGVPREEIYIEREMLPLADRTPPPVVEAEVERRLAGTQAGMLVGFVFGLVGGLALALMNYTILAPHTEGVPGMPWPFGSYLWSAVLCGVVGLLIGGALGFTIDWTLSRLGAGPAKPSEECLVTISADETYVEKAETVLFKHNARHVLQA